MTPNTRRFEELVASMRARLRPLCADWPEPIFEEMVQRLADITLKYEGRGADSPYDRRSNERLLTDMTEMLDQSEDQRDEAK